MSSERRWGPTYCSGPHAQLQCLAEPGRDGTCSSCLGLGHSGGNPIQLIVRLRYQDRNRRFRPKLVIGRPILRSLEMVYRGGCVAEYLERSPSTYDEQIGVA
jgi:hypothetical protein